MDTKAEEPRTKANTFRVLVFDSKEWANIKSLDTYTIKEMNIAKAAKVESKPTATKSKKVELVGPVV